MVLAETNQEGITKCEPTKRHLRSCALTKNASIDNQCTSMKHIGDQNGRSSNTVLALVECIDRSQVGKKP